jgi:hypothetical protein
MLQGLREGQLKKEEFYYTCEDLLHTSVYSDHFDCMIFSGS